MMYLIYNSNGSVKYENLVDFIVQGSNDVNKILISIDEHEPTAFSLSGHFVLPDGTITDISSDTTDSVEIDGTTYYGVVLSLTSEVTALEGLVRVNIVAKENDTDKVLVTMQTFLTVNSGVSGSEIAIISQAEYNNLLSQIQRNVSNYETILTFIGTFPAPTNYRDGQVIYFVAPGSNMGYLYQKIDGAWVQVFNFKNYYTKDEVYAKSETYSKTEVDSALSGKLDKKTTSGTYVYGHNGSTQNEYSVSLSPSTNSIPVRGENGRLYVVETPTFTAEAASKYYVDSQVATKSSVSGLEANGKWYSLTIDGVTHLIGGSGGGDYTAGTGINISGGNEISIDDTVVATQSDLQVVREVAEGKCKAFLLSYQQTSTLPNKFYDADGNLHNANEFNDYVSGLTCGNSLFNSQSQSLKFEQMEGALYTIWYYYIFKGFNSSVVGGGYPLVIKSTEIKKLFHNGDIIYIIETQDNNNINLPDRWVYNVDGEMYAYKLETSKVDLTNYYTKTQTNGLLANEFSAESTYTVGDYVIYNGTLYRCVSDIETAGAWNSSYWTSVKVANDFVNKNADNIFNVINASDISSNTLTQEQYDLVTNGRPTLIKGTISGKINPFILPCFRDDGTYIRCYSLSVSEYSQLLLNGIYINKSTRVMTFLANTFLMNDTGRIDISGFGYVNGKLFPVYPSSPATNQVLTYKTDNTMAWLPASQAGIYNHHIKFTMQGTNYTDWEFYIDVLSSEPNAIADFNGLPYACYNQKNFYGIWNGSGSQYSKFGVCLSIGYSTLGSHHTISFVLGSGMYSGGTPSFDQQLYGTVTPVFVSDTVSVI